MTERFSSPIPYHHTNRILVLQWITMEEPQGIDSPQREVPKEAQSQQGGQKQRH